MGNVYRTILEAEGFRVADMALLYFHANAHLEPRVWIDVHRLNLKYDVTDGKFEFARVTEESFADAYKLKTWHPIFEHRVLETLEDKFSRFATTCYQRFVRVENKVDDVDYIISKFAVM